MLPIRDFFVARPWLTILVWALAVAMTLTATAAFTNNHFYKRWPLQGDTASYWIRDIALTSTQQMSRRSIDAGTSSEVITKNETPNHRMVALAGAAQNPRDPARTAFYALLPEGAAYSVNGHLPYSGVATFVFLALLAIALFRRTGSLLYAVTCGLGALMPSGLLNPMYGLPSKLPDLPASFMFGASLFAIFAADRSKKSELSWIFFSGALLGISALMRYQVWLYGLFVLGPIALIYGIRRYRNEGGRPLDLIAYPAMLLIGLSVVAGYFIVVNAADTFKFYMLAGYALNSTIAASLRVTGVQLLHHVGLPAALLVALIFAAVASMARSGKSSDDKWDRAAVTWALIAYPILLFVIMRVESILEQTFYAIPGALIFFLAPFNRSMESGNSYSFNKFCKFLVVIMPIALSANIYSYLTSESFVYPRPKEAEMALFQQKLVDMVALNLPTNDSDRIQTIDANFTYYGRFLQPLIKSKFNRNVKSLQAFDIRKSQWAMRYSGNERDDGIAIVNVINKKVDIFVALDEPRRNAILDAFGDEYTENIAYHVNRYLSSTPAIWENCGSVDGPYGKVIVYKNTSLRS